MDEAIAETKHALEADPLSLPVNTSAIFIFYLARKSDLALEQCHKTLELDPNFARAHADCGRAYEGEERYEQASAELLKAPVCRTAAQCTLVCSDTPRPGGKPTRGPESA